MHTLFPSSLEMRGEQTHVADKMRFGCCCSYKGTMHSNEQHVNFTHGRFNSAKVHDDGIFEYLLNIKNMSYTVKIQMLNERNNYQSIFSLYSFRQLMLLYNLLYLSIKLLIKYILYVSFVYETYSQRPFRITQTSVWIFSSQWQILSFPEISTLSLESPSIYYRCTLAVEETADAP